jgi:3-dehydroquinate dehydratase / shikimate dehydrogenase
MAKRFIFEKDCVCGVVAARTAADAQRQIRSALRCTQTLEVRFDWLSTAAERARLIGVLKNSGILRRAAITATCRGRKAGGNFSGSLLGQLSVLRSAIDAGCEWTDLEIEAIDAVPPFTLDLYTSKARRIASYHDYRRAPSRSELEGIMRRMKTISERNGFDAIKIAAQCDSLRDALDVLDLARQSPESRLIAVPMGDVASPLRLLAPRFGSALCYAPVEQSTAPGQISLSDLRELCRSGGVSSRTRIYGVIGDPIAHSLSPVLHNAGFHARKIDAIYLPFRVIDLEDFLDAIVPLGISGFSITLPLKEKILAHLDRIDPLAASVGAANTVVVQHDAKLLGYNTDCLGILRSLEGRLPIRGSRALIFGAGGVARAAAFALEEAGASVSICSRRMDRVRRLAAAVHGEAIARNALKKMSFDVIINATPLGMHPHENQSPLTSQEMNCRLAFDTVYRPRKTKFLQLAAKRGIETVSGLEMFLAQGIAQWEIWTGQSAPVAAMRRAVLEAVRHVKRKKE